MKFLRAFMLFVIVLSFAVGAFGAGEVAGLQKYPAFWTPGSVFIGNTNPITVYSGANIGSVGSVVFRVPKTGSLAAAPTATTTTGWTLTEATTSGIGFLVTSTAALTGSALSVVNANAGTNTVTGDLLKLSCKDTANNGAKFINCYGGTGATSVFSVAEGGNTVVAGTLGVTGNVTIAGTTNFKWAFSAKTANYPVVVGDNNTIFTTTGASGTVVFTLPSIATSTGCRFKFVNTVGQTMTVRVATADLNKVIVFNNGTTADGVTYSTAGNLFGATCLAICDGTNWIIVNESPNTQTIETALS